MLLWGVLPLHGNEAEVLIIYNKKFEDCNVNHGVPTFGLANRVP